MLQPLGRKTADVEILVGMQLSANPVSEITLGSYGSQLVILSAESAAGIRDVEMAATPARPKKQTEHLCQRFSSDGRLSSLSSETLTAVRTAAREYGWHGRLARRVLF